MSDNIDSYDGIWPFEASPQRKQEILTELLALKVVNREISATALTDIDLDAKTDYDRAAFLIILVLKVMYSSHFDQNGQQLPGPTLHDDKVEYIANAIVRGIVGGWNDRDRTDLAGAYGDFELVFEELTSSEHIAKYDETVRIAIQDTKEALEKLGREHREIQAAEFELSLDELSWEAFYNEDNEQPDYPDNNID